MRKNLTVPRQLMPKEGKIYAKTTQLLCAPSDPKKLPHIFQDFQKDALVIKSGHLKKYFQYFQQFRFVLILSLNNNQCLKNKMVIF